MKITVDRALLEQAIDNCLFDAIGYSLAGMQIPFGDIDTVATEVKKSFTENVASYKALRDALAAPPQVPLVFPTGVGMNRLKMSAMQQALNTLLQAETTIDDALSPQHKAWRAEVVSACDALIVALAQQWGPQQARSDFIAGYGEGMADAKRMQAAQEAEKPLREPVDGKPVA